MSLKLAIQNKDMKELKETVEKSVSIYGAAMPDESKSMVETVHGEVPVAMLFDEDSKWTVITGEYVRITNAVNALPKCCDLKVETAKIIASSAILRHVTAEATTSSDDLL